MWVGRGTSVGGRGLDHPGVSNWVLQRYIEERLVICAHGINTTGKANTHYLIECSRRNL